MLDLPHHRSYHVPMANTSGFPRFQVTIDGLEHWLPLERAGRALNNYLTPVSLGSRALEDSGETRQITREEHNRMIDIAEKWDAAK